MIAPFDRIFVFEAFKEKPTSFLSFDMLFITNLKYEYFTQYFKKAKLLSPE